MFVGVVDDNKVKQLINKDVLKKIDGYIFVGICLQLSMEKIVLLKFDLIIVDMICYKKVYDQLKKIVLMIVLNNLNVDYQDIIDVVFMIVKVVGKEKEMEKKLMVYEEKFSEIKQKISVNSQFVFLIGNINDMIMVRDESFFILRFLIQVGY